MLVALLISQVLYIEGLPCGELLYRETGPMEYEIAIAFNGGEGISPWAFYPLYFNPAKTDCCFNSADMTLEVVSQLPYSANYTYAWYLVDSLWSLTLYDSGEGGYYEEAAHRVYELLEANDFEGAVIEAESIMYPGSLPEPDRLCAMLVIAAADRGTAEAFQQVQSVCSMLSNCELYNLDIRSEEYLSALKVYSELADPYTAQLVLERLRVDYE